jgi:MYXO-CTERM domain-containing protein
MGCVHEDCDVDGGMIGIDAARPDAAPEDDAGERDAGPSTTMDGGTSTGGSSGCSARAGGGSNEGPLLLGIGALAFLLGRRR